MIRTIRRLSFTIPFTGALVLAAVRSGTAAAQDSATGRARPLPTIEAKTAGMRKLDGFFPLYWDADAGTLYMEIPRLDTEVLDMDGLASGLGSNDIGLDRAAVTGSRVVRFERVGRKVLMVQPNLNFRSSSHDPAEVADVRDAFASSVLWGFDAVAQSDSGQRVLVSMNDFLLHDPANIAQRLGPGSYKLDAGRSAVSMAMTQNFPENTEMEAELTFVLQPGGRGNTGGGMAYFEGVGAVSATPDAATLRLHHSFIQLPDTAGFTPRAYDPSSGLRAVLRTRITPRRSIPSADEAIHHPAPPGEGRSVRPDERSGQADHLLRRSRHA